MLLRRGKLELTSVGGDGRRHRCWGGWHSGAPRSPYQQVWKPQLLESVWKMQKGVWGSHVCSVVGEILWVNE